MTGDANVKVRDHMEKKVRKRVTGDENTRVRDHVKHRVVQLKVRATEPSAAKKLDQWSFTIGVLGMVFSEYALVQHTELFHVWYAALVPPLVLVKWGIYKTRKMHYFLLDFCYYVNLVLVGAGGLPLRAGRPRLVRAAQDRARAGERPRASCGASRWSSTTSTTRARRTSTCCRRS